MRIEFDSNSPTELSAVFVAIAVLRGGDMSLPLLDDDRVEISSEPLAPFVPPAPAAPPAPTIDTAALAVHTPAPPVPAAPAVAPALAGAVDTDADGLPWDNRIHSTPASKKKDGRWRGKRGLDEATRTAVMAQLKQAMAAPAVAPPPPVAEPMFGESAPGVPLPPTSEPPVDAATAFGAADATLAPSAPPAPPAVAAPAPPVAAPAPVVPAPPAETVAVTDFAGLMRKITGLQSAGALTVEGTTEISKALGITGVRDLMARPDLIPSFDALLPVVG